MSNEACPVWYCGVGKTNKGDDDGVCGVNNFLLIGDAESFLHAFVACKRCLKRQELLPMYSRVLSQTDGVEVGGDGEGGV